MTLEREVSCVCATFLLLASVSVVVDVSSMVERRRVEETKR